jgi:hypothetical protein
MALVNDFSSCQTTVMAMVHDWHGHGTWLAHDFQDLRPRLGLGQQSDGTHAGA